MPQAVSFNVPSRRCLFKRQTQDEDGFTSHLRRKELSVPLKTRTVLRPTSDEDGFTSNLRRGRFNVPPQTKSFTVILGTSYPSERKEKNYRTDRKTRVEVDKTTNRIQSLLSVLLSILSSILFRRWVRLGESLSDMPEDIIRTMEATRIQEEIDLRKIHIKAKTSLSMHLDPQLLSRQPGSIDRSKADLVTTSKDGRSGTDTLPVGVERSPSILEELLLIEKRRTKDTVCPSYITLQAGRSRDQTGEFPPKEFTRQGQIPPSTEEWP
jgi:hypothetical protein